MTTTSTNEQQGPRDGGTRGLCQVDHVVVAELDTTLNDVDEPEREPQQCNDATHRPISVTRGGVRGRFALQTINRPGALARPDPGVAGDEGEESQDGVHSGQREPRTVNPGDVPHLHEGQVDTKGECHVDAEMEEPIHRCEHEAQRDPLPTVPPIQDREAGHETNGHQYVEDHGGEGKDLAAEDNQRDAGEEEPSGREHPLLHRGP